MARAQCPLSVHAYLVGLTPPATQASQVALIGEKEEMITKVAAEAKITELTLELNARALALGVFDSANLGFGVVLLGFGLS